MGGELPLSGAPYSRTWSVSEADLAISAAKSPTENQALSSSDTVRLFDRFRYGQTDHRPLLLVDHLNPSVRR